jgi:predicted ATPase
VRRRVPDSTPSRVRDRSAWHARDAAEWSTARVGAPVHLGRPEGVGSAPRAMSIMPRSTPVGAPFHAQAKAGPPTHAFEIHGRDADIALIRTKLERLGEGAGAVVIVEGGAGMGKSRLLTEVHRIGRSRGVAVGSSAAESDASVVELAALLSALFDGQEPLLDRRELPNLRALSDQRFWLLQDLQQVLERAALEAPIMISIDDVQWADSGTAAALRTLSAQLSGFPIAWVIAARPSQGSLELVSTLELLKRNGAATVFLGPLESGAVAELAAEVLQADPDEATLDLIREAQGSPFLLV